MSDKKLRNIRYKFTVRFLANFLILSVLLTSSVDPAIATTASIQINNFTEPAKASFFRISEFNIPESVGRVESIRPITAAKNESPVIIHIRDAHGSYEAQRHTKEIIEHISEAYGIKTILLEAASTELDPHQFKLFEDESLNFKIADYMAQNGDLSGAELFLLDHLDDPSIHAEGIENLEAFVKNLKTFQKVASRRSDVNSYLKDLRAQIEVLGSRQFNKDLKDFLRSWLAWRDERLDLIGFLNVIKRFASSRLEIDLAHAKSQIEYPTLVRFFKAQNLESKMDLAEALSELDGLRSLIRPLDISAELKAGLEDLNLEAGVKGFKAGLPRVFLEDLYQTLSRYGFEFEYFPELSKVLAALIFQSEIDGIRFFDEIEKAIDAVFKALIESDEEKSLVELIQKSILLEKLLKLELVRSEVALAMYRKDSLSPSFLMKMLGERRDVSPDSIKVSAELDDIFESAIDFYQGAVAREKYFIENTKAVLERIGRHSAILVSGGFHSDGLEELFAKENYSYIEISPRLSSVEGVEKIYLESMLGTRKTMFDQSQIRNLLEMVSDSERSNVARALHPDNLALERRVLARSEIRKLEAIFSQVTDVDTLTQRSEMRTAIIDGKEKLIAYVDGRPRFEFPVGSDASNRKHILQNPKRVAAQRAELRRLNQIASILKTTNEKSELRQIAQEASQTIQDQNRQIEADATEERSELRQVSLGEIALQERALLNIVKILNREKGFGLIPMNIRLRMISEQAGNIVSSEADFLENLNSLAQLNLSTASTGTDSVLSKLLTKVNKIILDQSGGELKLDFADRKFFIRRIPEFEESTSIFGAKSDDSNRPENRSELRGMTELLILGAGFALGVATTFVTRLLYQRIKRKKEKMAVQPLPFDVQNQEFQEYLLSALNQNLSKENKEGRNLNKTDSSGINRSNIAGWIIVRNDTELAKLGQLLNSLNPSQQIVVITQNPGIRGKTERTLRKGNMQLQTTFKEMQLPQAGNFDVGIAVKAVFPEIPEYQSWLKQLRFATSFSEVWLLTNQNTGEIRVAKLNHAPADRYPRQSQNLLSQKEEDIIRRLGQGRMAKHFPQIIGAHDSERGRVVIMNFIKDIKYQKDLRGNTKLEIKNVESFFAQLAEIIEHMHRNGVIHHDLFHSNILVDETGNVVVIDFLFSNLAEVDSEGNFKTDSQDRIVYSDLNLDVIQDEAQRQQVRVILGGLATDAGIMAPVRLDNFVRDKSILERITAIAKKNPDMKQGPYSDIFGWAILLSYVMKGKLKEGSPIYQLLEDILSEQKIRTGQELVNELRAKDIFTRYLTPIESGAQKSELRTAVQPPPPVVGVNPDRPHQFAPRKSPAVVKVDGRPQAQEDVVEISEQARKLAEEAEKDRSELREAASKIVATTVSDNVFDILAVQNPRFFSLVVEPTLNGIPTSTSVLPAPVQVTDVGRIIASRIEAAIDALIAPDIKIGTPTVTVDGAGFLSEAILANFDALSHADLRIVFSASNSDVKARAQKIRDEFVKAIVDAVERAQAAGRLSRNLRISDMPFIPLAQTTDGAAMAESESQLAALTNVFVAFANWGSVRNKVAIQELTIPILRAAGTLAKILKNKSPEEQARLLLPLKSLGFEFDRYTGVVTIMFDRIEALYIEEQGRQAIRQAA